MVRFWKFRAIAGLVGLGVAAVPLSAWSAADVNPPVLTTPLKASFLVGGQVNGGALYACGDDVPRPGDLRVFAPITFRWSATDDVTPRAKLRYDLEDYSGKYGRQADFDDSAQTSYTATEAGWSAGNYDNDCGNDGQQISKWFLTGRDASGNEATRMIGGGFLRITQDDNLTDTANLAVRPSVTYAGSWTGSTCLCWSNGTDHHTSVAGASATVTVTVPAGAPTHLALVMSKAANRGSFRVSIDDAPPTTVSTYAATSQPRIIAWQGALPAGVHEVKLVNLATPGHPRIDLDAILTN